MKNLLGRDICPDIDADVDAGEEYNTEVQRADKDASTVPGKLMCDFFCTNSGDMSCKEPGDRRFFMDNKKGIVKLNNEMPDQVTGGKGIYDNQNCHPQYEVHYCTKCEKNTIHIAYSGGRLSCENCGNQFD